MDRLAAKMKKWNCQDLTPLVNREWILADVKRQGLPKMGQEAMRLLYSITNAEVIDYEEWQVVLVKRDTAPLVDDDPWLWALQAVGDLRAKIDHGIKAGEYVWDPYMPTRIWDPTKRTWISEFFSERAGRDLPVLGNWAGKKSLQDLFAAANEWHKLKTEAATDARNAKKKTGAIENKAEKTLPDW